MRDRRHVNVSFSPYYDPWPSKRGDLVQDWQCNQYLCRIQQKNKQYISPCAALGRDRNKKQGPNIANSNLLDIGCRTVSTSPLEPKREKGKHGQMHTIKRVDRGKTKQGRVHQNGVMRQCLNAKRKQERRSSWELSARGRNERTRMFIC